MTDQPACDIEEAVQAQRAFRHALGLGEVSDLLGLLASPAAPVLPERRRDDDCLVER